MNILIACEESQAVCKEMRRLGHEAYSADIQDCSGGYPEWHIKGDVLPLINGRCEFTTMDGQRHKILGKWDMIIAHPPCTYISNAGACRLYPHKGQLDFDRYNKGLEAKEFFLKFFNADCDFIAIENPVHSRVFNMPPFSQEIQPYQFGHPFSKKTRLWLKGLPELVSTEILDKYTPFLPSGTGRKIKSTYGSCKRGDDAKNRSKTFLGIARVMAEQWTNFIMDSRGSEV